MPARTSGKDQTSEWTLWFLVLSVALKATKHPRPDAVLGVLSVVLYWVTVRSSVNAFPDSWAEGSQMEGENHDSPASFSQENCFHGSQLQGSTSVSDKSRFWGSPVFWMRMGPEASGVCKKTLQDNYRVLIYLGYCQFIHTIYLKNKYLFDYFLVHSQTQNFGLSFTPCLKRNKTVVRIWHFSILSRVTFYGMIPTHRRLLLTPVEVFFGGPQEPWVLHAEVLHSCWGILLFSKTHPPYWLKLSIYLMHYFVSCRSLI